MIIQVCNQNKKNPQFAAAAAIAKIILMGLQKEENILLKEILRYITIPLWELSLAGQQEVSPYVGVSWSKVLVFVQPL